MTPRWEHFPHGADMGVRGFGPTKAEAFVQAALALTAVVVDPAEVAPREAVAIQCEAPDDELLLAEWLNSLIFEMSTRRMLFGRFEVRFDGPLLTGRAWGEPKVLEIIQGIENRLERKGQSNGAIGPWT